MEDFNKFTRLWDELSSVVPVLNCDCEIGRQVAAENLEDRVTQFIMGLNESYDNLKNQIMLMDHIPSIDKTYSMFLTAERQRSLQINTSEYFDSSAMVAKTNTYGRGSTTKLGFGGNNWNTGSSWNKGKPKAEFIKRTKEEKAKLVCDHCGGTGHDMTTCFKIHGIPDWYNELKEQRSRNYAHTAEYDHGDTYSGHGDERKGGQSTEFSAILQQLQEMTKYLKDKDKPDPGHEFAQFVSFSGNVVINSQHLALTTLEDIRMDCWIIDTGASRHMCTNPKLVQNLTTLKRSVTVCLPDGSTIEVKHT